LPDTEIGDVDSPRMRSAGKGLLSLALMDARNHTLRWMAAYANAFAETGLRMPQPPELNPPLWEFGHVGWFQEFWIARNLQRSRGAACDPNPARLTSIEPRTDQWYGASNVARDERWYLDLPDLAATRQYLVATFEATLELLDASDETDDALYMYRMALCHEDAHCEALACMSQTLGFDAGLLPLDTTLVARAPLLFPATRHAFGVSLGGFVFDNEQWADDVAVPEFEIDAQAVRWGQYIEFVEDGGYDNARWWSPEGWAWVQRVGRRCPRHVEQMRHGVLAQRVGKLTRVPLALPVTHVSWYEADAWCRWAGRRLPTEVEWEHAATAGASRGLRWGQVWEWTASTFRPYPGFTAGPDREYSEPSFGTHKVLRGASIATRGRLRDARYRNFQLPERDDIFSGFRSCAA